MGLLKAAQIYGCGWSNRQLCVRIYLYVGELGNHEFNHSTRIEIGAVVRQKGKVAAQQRSNVLASDVMWSNIPSLFQVLG